MDKKNKTENEVDEIVKKIKTTFINIIVEMWLHTPAEQWEGKTPLQLIKDGQGQMILEAIKTVKVELRSELKKNLSDINDLNPKSRKKVLSML